MFFKCVSFGTSDFIKWKINGEKKLLWLERLAITAGDLKEVFAQNLAGDCLNVCLTICRM